MIDNYFLDIKSTISDNYMDNLVEYNVGEYNLNP